MKTKLLIGLAVLALAFGAWAREPKKITVPKPVIAVAVEKKQAVVTLHSGAAAIVYEVQRKSGSRVKRWRTIGYFLAGQPGFVDQNPPARSQWRVRGIGEDAGRSAFSDAVP
jgi:hypothetical protein